MERKSLKNLIDNQLGQTAVEYILLIVVMATIMSSLLITIKSRYLGDITKCDRPGNAKTLLCKINDIVKPQGTDKKFQYFPFKK